MNYLDYAYDLNQLEDKFKDNTEVVSAIKELRSAFMNDKEFRDIIDVFFKVLFIIPVDEVEDYDQHDIDAAYTEGWNEALSEAYEALENTMDTLDYLRKSTR